MPYDVEHEITLVKWYVAKVGTKQADGTFKCTFGDIFYDEEAEQIFESLVCLIISIHKFNDTF